MHETSNACSFLRCNLHACILPAGPGAPARLCKHALSSDPSSRFELSNANITHTGTAPAGGKQNKGHQELLVLFCLCARLGYVRVLLLLHAVAGHLLTGAATSCNRHPREGSERDGQCGFHARPSHPMETQLGRWASGDVGPADRTPPLANWPIYCDTSPRPSLLTQTLLRKPQNPLPSAVLPGPSAMVSFVVRSAGSCVLPVAGPRRFGGGRLPVAAAPGHHRAGLLAGWSVGTSAGLDSLRPGMLLSTVSS
jgi:hypothetical protein